MKKRVFLAINLNKQAIESIKNLVEELKPKFRYGVRFLPTENWHITLSFLGYQDDNSVLKIVRILQNAVGNIEAPEIVFKKLFYGPLGRTPRMIWLLTDEATSYGLSKIKQSLEREFYGEGILFTRAPESSHCKAGDEWPKPEGLSLRGSAPRNPVNKEAAAVRARSFTKENRPFVGHITLSRFSGARGFPKIEKEVNIRSDILSLDLMESELKRDGAQYTTLQKFPLVKQK